MSATSPTIARNFDLSKEDWSSTSEELFLSPNSETTSTTPFTLDVVTFQNVVPIIRNPNVSRQSAECLIHDVVKPIEKDQITQCIIKRVNKGPFKQSNIYHLFGYEDSPLLVAKCCSTPTSTKFNVFEPSSGKKIGKIRSDWKSLKYEIRGPEGSMKVVYKENFIGKNGIRSFYLITDKNEKYIVKPPIVINGNYYQNFHDLSLIPSIKNFILVPENDFSKEILTLVRLNSDSFALRVSYGFNILYGFMICLTSLHTGIFHR